MKTIKTTIRNRRIDAPAPSDIPDGTEVLLTIDTAVADGDGPLPPEEIARVLAAMQKIEPFDWSDEERSAADAWEKKVNDYTIANLDKGIEDVFR